MSALTHALDTLRSANAKGLPSEAAVNAQKAVPFTWTGTKENGEAWALTKNVKPDSYNSMC